MKFKIVFYLSSGQTFKLKCKKFDMSKLTGTKGNRSLTIDGTNKIWSINIDEIIAVKVTKWLF